MTAVPTITTTIGRAAEALQSLNEPVLLERYKTEGWITALFHRVRGAALAAQGETAGARDAFALGREVAEKQGAGLHLARIERAESALR